MVFTSAATTETGKNAGYYPPEAAHVGVSFPICPAVWSLTPDCHGLAILFFRPSWIPCRFRFAQRPSPSRQPEPCQGPFENFPQDRIRIPGYGSGTNSRFKIPHRAARTTKPISSFKIQMSPASLQTVKRCRMLFRASIRRSSTLGVRVTFLDPVKAAADQ